MMVELTAKNKGKSGDESRVRNWDVAEQDGVEKICKMLRKVRIDKDCEKLVGNSILPT